MDPERLDYASPQAVNPRGRSLGQWLVLLAVWAVGLIVWTIYILVFGYLLLRML